MSAYVGKLFTAVSSALEFNTATLSGAIDIIVVEDDAGRRQSTPFHVRFGKLQLLKSRGIPVSIYLNGNRTSLSMLLGAAGEAYFYNPHPLAAGAAPGSAFPAVADAAATVAPTIVPDQGPQALGNSDAESLTLPVIPVVNSAPLDLALPLTAPPPELPMHSVDPLMRDSSVTVAAEQHTVASASTSNLTVSSSSASSVFASASSLPAAASPTVTSAPAAPLAASASASTDTAAFAATVEQAAAYNTTPSPSPPASAQPSADRLPSVSETVDTDYPFSYISDSEVELTRAQRDGANEVVDEPRSPPLIPPSRNWAVAPHNPAAQTVHSVLPVGRQTGVSPSSSSSRIAPQADKTVQSQAQTQTAAPAEAEPQLSSSTIPPASTEAQVSTESETKTVQAKAQKQVRMNVSGEVLGHATARGRSLTPPDETAEEHNSALFGLPASAPSSPAPGSKLTRRTSVNDGIASAPGDRERALVQPIADSTANDVTVTDTLSDVVGEEDSKLECRSLDGYDPDDDALDTLHTTVSRVLTSGPSASIREDVTPDGPRVVAPHTPASEGDATTVPGEAGELLVMSMCGQLLSPDMAEEQILELFERHRVGVEEFASNPNLLFDPSMRFRIDNRIVEFRVAAPLMFAAMAYKKQLDVDDLARAMVRTEKNEPIEPPKSPPTPRRFRWLPWSSPAVEGEPLLGEDDINELEKRDVEAEKQQAEDREKTDAEKDEPVNAEKEGDPQGKEQEKHEVKTLDESSVTPESEPRDESKTKEEDRNGPKGNNAEDPDAEQETDLDLAAVTPTISFSDLDPDSLSLKPTSEDLNSLDLKPGANSVRFVVESSAVELTCRIFLWSCHHQVVISDVDGTITRSDVLGHLLPAVGRDWSQVGVAGLYSQIEKNGYKLMYLTARPIGQASQTRAFLRNVTQGSAKLPNGPVLMSPNRLVESFTREVIRRKPHEFKIAALRELRSLFSPASNPFYAGFGNRDTDVISYRAVGLMPQRIFVVNPKGELVVMKSRFESAASYSTLQDLVESVFPDISGKQWLAKTKAMTENATFNDWNYWKGSLPEIDLDELLENE